MAFGALYSCSSNSQAVQVVVGTNLNWVAWVQDPILWLLIFLYSVVFTSLIFFQKDKLYLVLLALLLITVIIIKNSRMNNRID